MDRFKALWKNKTENKSTPPSLNLLVSSIKDTQDLERLEILVVCYETNDQAKGKGKSTSDAYLSHKCGIVPLATNEQGNVKFPPLLGVHDCKGTEQLFAADLLKFPYRDPDSNMSIIDALAIDPPPPLPPLRVRLLQSLRKGWVVMFECAAHTTLKLITIW